MATHVILPALGMAQDTGTIVRWLKSPGQTVHKGEPLVEIETDKATVEIEAEATGILADVTAASGEVVPVGQVIATILAPDEAEKSDRQGEATPSPSISTASHNGSHDQSLPPAPNVPVSPLASKIANEHNLDLRLVTPIGKRIQQADVLNYLQSQQQSATPHFRLQPASPKARRLAAEQGKELAAIQGTGPAGAVLAADVLAAITPSGRPSPIAELLTEELTVSNIWRVMAERTTQSWTGVPHFYLVREVNASRLLTWRELAQKRSAEKITYTDLLVKVVAAALRLHPRLNASWTNGKLLQHREIAIGLAVAVPDGLVVPVIAQADTCSLQELAHRRQALVAKAQAGRLHLQDIQGGTFTLSNLGMYGVDAFNAIIHSPQAAILAVGRIAQRVVPVNGVPAVQPMMVLSLSCDHRVVDGAHAAQFLNTLAELLEEPLGLLE